MPNPVVHFEIVGKDPGQLRDFYSGVFSWSIDANNPANYGMVDNGGEGINGGIAASDDEAPRAIFYIAVADTDDFLRKIEAAGGKTLVPTTVVPGMVVFALFQDPAGNTVGLVNAGGPPPA